MPFSTFYRLPEDKRNGIVDAALQEFITYKEDYSRSSIKRIAKNAGVSIGSMYQYFKDKDDLFFYICELYTQSPVQVSDTDSLFTIAQRQKEYILSLPKRCTHNELNEIIQKNVDVLFYSLLYEHIMDSPLYEKILSSLEHDSQRGLLRDSIDPKVAAYLYLTADFFGYYLNATTGTSGPGAPADTAGQKETASGMDEINEVTMQIVDIIFHGIYKKQT